jgi:hypothetical protein
VAGVANVGGFEPFQLSDLISWNTLAAIGPVQRVVFGPTPLIVNVDEPLYSPCIYQRTSPTDTVGVVNIHPVGATGPDVGVVNVGVAEAWLCDR